MADTFDIKRKSAADDADERLRRCVGCGKSPPNTNSSYTLISSTHGWRLTPATVQGRRVMEWRCPQCWRVHRERADAKR
jgi:hypothetical protein